MVQENGCRICNCHTLFPYDVLHEFYNKISILCIASCKLLTRSLHSHQDIIHGTQFTFYTQEKKIPNHIYRVYSTTTNEQLHNSLKLTCKLHNFWKSITIHNS